MPSMIGICEGGASQSEDVDMESGGISKRRIIVGSADLNFKRNAMEI